MIKYTEFNLNILRNVLFRDKDGQYPFLTIFIHLDKLAHNPSPTAIDHQSIDLSHISEGKY